MRKLKAPYAFSKEISMKIIKIAINLFEKYHIDVPSADTVMNWQEFQLLCQEFSNKIKNKYCLENLYANLKKKTH